MKTYAGDLHVALPGDWDDESRYVYRQGDLNIEVRIERSPVDEAAKPDELMDAIVERLQLLPLDDFQRKSGEVDGKPVTELSVSSHREGDPETSQMYVAILKTSPSSAVTVTALAAIKQREQLQEIWPSLLKSLHTVTIQ